MTTVFYLDILTSMGENPIYIKPGVTHYIPINVTDKSAAEEVYTPPVTVNTSETTAPIDSYLSQICNIY